MDLDVHACFFSLSSTMHAPLHIPLMQYLISRTPSSHVCTGIFWDTTDQKPHALPPRDASFLYDSLQAVPPDT